MARELSRIDVSKLPELLRLAEEVRRTNKPLVLSRESEELALLSPVRPARRPSRRRSRGTTPGYTLEQVAGSVFPATATEDLDRIIAETKEDHAAQTVTTLERP